MKRWRYVFLPVLVLVVTPRLRSYEGAPYPTAPSLEAGVPPAPAGQSSRLTRSAAA